MKASKGLDRDLFGSGIFITYSGKGYFPRLHAA